MHLLAERWGRSVFNWSSDLEVFKTSRSEKPTDPKKEKNYETHQIHYFIIHLHQRLQFHVPVAELKTAQTG